MANQTDSDRHMDNRKPKSEASFAASDGSAYSPEAAEAMLQEVYQWLHNGPMDDSGKRCHFHRKIGDMLGRKRVEYQE